MLPCASEAAAGEPAMIRRKPLGDWLCATCTAGVEGAEMPKSLRKGDGSELGFRIERRGTTDVVVYAAGGCHPANTDEVAIWRRIAGLEDELEAALRSLVGEGEK